MDPLFFAITNPHLRVKLSPFDAFAYRSLVCVAQPRDCYEGVPSAPFDESQILRALLEYPMHIFTLLIAIFLVFSIAIKAIIKKIH